MFLRAMSCVVMLCVPLFGAPAHAAGTKFTYQGELMQNGSPVNGTVNLRFGLWNAAVGGTQIGGLILSNSHPVVDGKFTVELDWGADAFLVGDRWLEVRINSITLSPRQPINAAPFSIKTRGLYVNSDDTFTGVGRSYKITSAERFGIHINTNDFGGMYVETGSFGEPFYGYSRNGSVDAYHYYDTSSGQWRLNANGDRLVVNRTTGNVGIGNTAPDARLHVQSVGSEPTVKISNAGSGPALFVDEFSGGIAVHAVNNAPTGSAYGVFAHSLSSSGIGAFGQGKYGVYGFSSTGGLDSKGVYGVSSSADGVGVHGRTTGGGSNSAGILGQQSGNGWAGYFLGDVFIDGALVAASKNFMIDNPINPSEEYLVHACVESDALRNLYDGTVVLDERGEAVVKLPEWFEALNSEFRYQLTCIGGHAPVYVSREIEQNSFALAGGTPGLKVSWQVTGVRIDPAAQRANFQVIKPKAKADRGTYLCPEGYGEAASEEPTIFANVAEEK